MRRFFACSVGEPGKGYDEENLQRIIDNKAFVLHRDTIQKGVYEEIAPGDILLLKYRNGFVAYGETTGKVTTADPEWNLTAPVKEWFFKNEKNPAIGVSAYGIQDSTLAGSGQMGTVKEIDEKFGLEKLKEIDGNSQLYTTIIKDLEKRKYMQQVKDIVNLLKYKKQIILQGPPGTGKTRKAKEIAKQLIIPKKIQEQDIISFLKIGDRIKSGKDYTSYLIIGFGDGMMMLANQLGNPLNINYSEIIEAFENRTWDKNSLTNGNKSASAGIARFIYNEYLSRSNQFNIIQFHPSYTYEDFVRGIAAENKGTQIEYVTKKKVIAKIASFAEENYLNSFKESQTISKENWLNNEFELFIEEVDAEILKDGEFKLNSKVSVYNVEEDAFRYHGPNWEYKQRMKFKDLKIEYLTNVNSRRDIKSLTNVSGRSKQHATYDLMMVEKFRSFLQDRPSFNPGAIEKEELKNFVLIIDEINRANLSSVLGELIYALEYRGESLGSIYELDEDADIILPPNLYIIGTMNTADRSVGHIDYAIRRRLSFVDVLPKDLSGEMGTDFKSAIFQKVYDLFYDADRKYLSSEFEPDQVCLGHSYFIQHYEKDERGNPIKDKPIDFKLRLQYEIIPILKEYIKDGVLKDSEELRDIIKSLVNDLS
jgi:hypothetical protein